MKKFIIATCFLFFASITITVKAADKKSVQSQAAKSPENTDNVSWYAQKMPSFECGEDEGPSKIIEMLQTLQKEYRVIDDKKVGGVVVQATVQMLDEGGQITFYRGKERCEAALKASKARQKSEVDKYR